MENNRKYEDFKHKWCKSIGYLGKPSHIIGKMVYMGYSSEHPTGRQFDVTCARCGYESIVSESELKKMKSFFINRMMEDAIKNK